MRWFPVLATPWILVVALLVGLVAESPDASAQTATVTYDLQDVWLLPDTTHPRAAAQPMTGTFVWTYTAGKFEGGSGKFTSLSIPWWGTRTTPSLKITIDTKAIELTMDGNYHGLGLDIGMHFATPLSADKVSPIDTLRSKFQVEVGVSHAGHFTGGRIVPRCPLPMNYGNGSAGSGAHIPTITSSGGAPRIGNGSFRIDCDRLLGGASCFLLLGTRKAQIPIVGVTLLVDPGSWLLMLPLTASGTVGIAGVGTLRVPIGIPADPRLVALPLFLQAAAIDPGAPQGVVAATNGLEVVICAAAK